PFASTGATRRTKCYPVGEPRRFFDLRGPGLFGYRLRSRTSFAGWRYANHFLISVIRLRSSLHRTQKSSWALFIAQPPRRIFVIDHSHLFVSLPATCRRPFLLDLSRDRNAPESILPADRVHQQLCPNRRR